MPDFRLLTPGGLELTALDFAEIAPGSSYSARFGGPLEFRLENTGPAKVARKLVAVERAPYPTHTQISFSTDGFTFTVGEVVLGEFAAGEIKTVYADVAVSSGDVTGSGQRCDLDIVPA